MKTYFNNLPPFEKRVVFGVGVLLFVILNFWFVFPHFSDWGDLQRRRGEAEEKVAQYTEMIRQQPTMEKQVKSLESENLGVPPEEQSIQFSRAIQQQQAQSGVAITGTTKPMSRTNQFFLEMSQTISITSGEKQLVDFLYNLGSGNSLIRVRDLTLRPDAPRYNLNSNVKLVASFQKKLPTRPARGSTPAGTGSSSTSTAKTP